MAFRVMKSQTWLHILLIWSWDVCGHGDVWSVTTHECPPRIPAPLQHHAIFGCPSPINEKVLSEPSRWSPWTHAPECVNATGRPGTEYCVYTNSRHGIGGMSLITTPETAAASIDLLDEIEYPHPRGNSAGNGSDRWPYKIVDMPGKGKGVVATRVIKQYEELMVDYASLVVDLVFPQALNREVGYDLLHTATDQLSDPRRVLTLGQSSSVAQDAIENVLRTNAFHTVLADREHMALFPDVSVSCFNLYGYCNAVRY